MKQRLTPELEKDFLRFLEIRDTADVALRKEVDDLWKKIGHISLAEILFDEIYTLRAEISKSKKPQYLDYIQLELESVKRERDFWKAHCRELTTRPE